MPVCRALVGVGGRIVPLRDRLVAATDSGNGARLAAGGNRGLGREGRWELLKRIDAHYVRSIPSTGSTVGMAGDLGRSW